MRCPVGALAILLHFMFDQEDLLGCLPEWDWENPASWRRVCRLCYFYATESKLKCLKLGPCAIWKARSSCNHRRCIRKNVHDLLGTYFNNIQAEDAPSSPHFSKGSWGNGVNQIFWIIKGGNELTLLQCSCWSSRCFRPLAGEHPTGSVWLENPKSGMLTFAAQTDKLNLTGYIPSCRRQSL